MHRSAIILCGGQSTRMGRDKASLPFGSESMLERVVHIVSQVVPLDRMVIVAAPDQQLPPLDDRITVVRDEVAHRGPLAGLATGLRKMQATFSDVDAVFVTGCDFPLLIPAFIERMFALLGYADAAIPVDHAHRHTLAAVYHPRVRSAIETMLEAGHLKTQRLIDEINAREVQSDDLRSVDQHLHSLRNINSADDFAEALKIAGVPLGGTVADPPDTPE